MDKTRFTRKKRTKQGYTCWKLGLDFIGSLVSTLNTNNFIKILDKTSLDVVKNTPKATFSFDENRIDKALPKSCLYNLNQLGTQMSPEVTHKLYWTINT